MPVRVAKRRGKFRIVEQGGRILKSVHGRPMDGGGHTAKSKAARQAGYINESMDQKRGS